MLLWFGYFVATRPAIPITVAVVAILRALTLRVAAIPLAALAVGVLVPPVVLTLVALPIPVAVSVVVILVVEALLATGDECSSRSSIGVWSVLHSRNVFPTP